VKIYLAGPLFTEAERDWLRNLKREIESLAESQGKKVNVISPYDLITQPEIEQLGNKAQSEIFSRCKSHLDDADMLIALLDGSQVDGGTAREIGYFCTKRSLEKKTIGIRNYGSGWKSCIPRSAS
jgi:nucleoside 2-deoxyribosyltransferase